MDDLQEASIPKNRTEILKWNGWGYKDTQFELGKVFVATIVEFRRPNHYS